MHFNSVVSFWMLLGCTCASIWAAENIGMPVLIPSHQQGSHNNAPKQITLNTQRSVPYHALALQKNAFKPTLVTPPIPTTPLQAQRRQDIPQPQYRPSTNSAVQRPPPQAPAQRAPLVKTTPLSTSVSHTVNNAQPRPVGAPVRSLQQPGFHTKTTGKVVLSNQRQSATSLRPVQQSAPYQRPSSTSFSKGGSNSFPEGFSKGLPSFDFGGGFPDVTESGNGFIDGKPANFPSLKTLGGFDSPFDSPKDFRYSASNQKPTKVVPPSTKPALRNADSSKLRVPAKEVALDHEFSRAKRGNTATQASAGPVPSSSSASAPPKPTYPQSINDILNSKDDETDNSPRHPPHTGQADIILDTSFFAKRLGNALDVADDEAFLEPDDFQPPINATDIDDVISAASHSEDILEVAEQRFNPSIGPFGTNGRPSPQAAPPTGRPSPANSFSSFRQRPLPPKVPSVDPQRAGNIRKPFSRNFDVVTGGLYRDTSDYRRPVRPFHHNNHFYDDHSHEEEDDFFSNFRDFADINHRRRGEHSQNKKRPVWSSDASYEEEDSDY